MLTGLRIGNFKAFAEEQQIPIRPVTLIYGANSSGKSSIIHGLLLANHALETDNWNVGRPRLGAVETDLGGFPHYIHKRLASAAFVFGCEMDGPQPDLVRAWTRGSEEERALFSSVSSFGLTVEVASRPGLREPSNQAGVPAIQSVVMSFDGSPGLRFERTEGSRFRCSVVAEDNPFLGKLIRSMLKCSAKQSARPRPGSIPLGALLDSEGNPRGNVPSERDRDEGAQMSCAMREEPPLQPSPFQMPDEVQFNKACAALQCTFRELMEEHEFQLHRDYGEARGGFWFEEIAPSVWDLPAFEEYTAVQLRDYCNENLLTFFTEWNSDNLERWLAGGESGRGPEAEARALRLNLCWLIRLLTLRSCLAIRDLRYLGPLRRVPHGKAIIFGMEAIPAEGLAQWGVVCSDSEARETVNRWLGAGWLGTSYRLDVREWDSNDSSAPNRLEPVFEDEASGLRLNPKDLGFGVGQVLPVLVEAATQKRKLITVEQPELHLHPAQQAELGDVFIESALGGRANRLLIETHSEHLLLRIMKRIRQTTAGTTAKNLPTIRPSDVAVLFVEKLGDRSIVREFPLNERGELVKPWPGGFFEEDLREVLG